MKPKKQKQNHISRRHRRFHELNFGKTFYRTHTNEDGRLNSIVP